MNYQKERDGFIDFVHANLVNTYEQGLSSNPLKAFHIGLLGPLEGESKSSTHKTRNSVASITAPSSAGFSFFVTGDDIQLSVVYGASYFTKDSSGKPLEGSFEWQKQTLSSDDYYLDISPPSKEELTQVVTEVFPNNRAKLYQTWRPYKEGFLVTLTLANQQSVGWAEKDNEKRAEATLFDVELNCTVLSGRLESYPQKDFALLSGEERELELRYKDVKTYAVGHAVAVDWSNEDGHFVLKVNFMPRVEVPSVTANTAGEETKHLNFNFLSTCHKNNDVISLLFSFAEEYKEWIINQAQLKSTMSTQEQVVAENIIARAKEAHTRIQDGITFLSQNKALRLAFAVMNSAMLKQMTATEQDPDLREYNWRPFQLAFVLMTMKSAVDEGDLNRDLVDLIWFPTGGGKTEAYLGVMALVFVYRRLVYPESQDSTVAIMRYTLTLLTGQQFARAAKVICALELIRRKSHSWLGTTPFTLGLWVGGSTTPNSFHQAQQELANQNYEKLGLASCPWCNAKFTEKNYLADERHFEFCCSNDSCEFGGSDNPTLPCLTVDESLYQRPPTLLLATVDKFAMLAWESRAEVFFGANGKRPPELIIQDELHLISGALGSMVGLYEVGIEAALIKRGIYPKYIASTATIRNAQEQVKQLYGKDSAVFPPSGLKHDDSFFARTVPTTEKPGRIYVGYMAYGKSKRDALEPLSSLLAVAPEIHFADKPEFKDAWWTQLVYHGSLKGVSASDASFKGPINRSIQQKLFEFSQTLPSLESSKAELNRYLNVKSLTSVQGAERNNQTFAQLDLSCDEADSVDIALATNMVSVGLDVERLAVMIINGQPLTTSEYIQASSRVGRGDIPGVVFVNYYKSQTSSLSHYENFRPYHESFYRYVEPTSLTPFTYQSLKKALHAAVIIAIRMSGIGFSSNASADSFNSSSPSIMAVIQIMKRRIRSAITGPFDSEHQHQEQESKLNTTLDMLDSLIDEWDLYVKNAKESRRQLQFHSRDRAAESLIKTHDVKRTALWDTQTSMRNVEDSCLVKAVRGLKQ
ncbi:DEAD/DEAH box helicase [Neiella marina]|uniref:DEAD/DEAH box helicase n=1 Tax=Neiella holothuriorum TaxID=2870530 RepID=A0ABS7EF48_9GAMM|nr:helicase-related protein [Neiella holothuriorum]MBW8190312.1 DEAD/DEAH box helicase [Neiella holothuriorum]